MKTLFRNMQYTRNRISSIFTPQEILQMTTVGFLLYGVLSKQGANLYIQYMHCTEAIFKRNGHIDFSGKNSGFFILRSLRAKLLAISRGCRMFELCFLVTRK